MYRLQCERERIGRQRRQSFIDSHAIIHKFKNFVSDYEFGDVCKKRNDQQRRRADRERD